MKNSDIILYDFLVNSRTITENEFLNLTEESKTQTLSDLTSTILKTVTDKSSSIETSLIDRTRGDIRQFKDLSFITDSINALEDMASRAATIQVGNKLVFDIKSIGKTLQYLNQFSPQFKDAYRNRKTLLILRYQSLVLSVISATAYLISTLVDFSSGGVKLNLNPDYEDIAPFKTIRSFINSVESGEFRVILRDLQVMRESFNENMNEDLASVIDAVNNGIRNFYSNIDNGGKTVQVLYKAAGVIALVLSVREIFYALGNMKTKVGDMLEGIKSFSIATKEKMVDTPRLVILKSV